MENKNFPDKSEFLLYTTEDGKTRVQVRLLDDTVWLTQKVIAELFQKDVRTINEHINNIFEEGELIPDSVIRKFRITAADGKNYDTAQYRYLGGHNITLTNGLIEYGIFSKFLTDICFSPFQI